MKPSRTRWVLIGAFAFLVLSFGGGTAAWNVLFGVTDLVVDGRASAVREALAGAGEGWPAYGGDKGGQRYSNADEITPANVHQLEPAWTLKTGALEGKGEIAKRTAFEATPIMARDKLVLCTQFAEIIAADPATGQVLWRHDPKVATDRKPANQYTCRGVSFWQDNTRASGECSGRIFVGTVDARLISVDIDTGKRCSDFGDGGQVQVEPSIALRWPGENADHLRAGDRRRHHRHRHGGGRQPAPRRAPGYGVGLRRAQRCVALALRPRASRAQRPDRCGQRVVDDRGRRRAAARLPTHLQPQPRPPRQPAGWRVAVSQCRGRAARRHRRGGLAFPDPAPRRVGLRPAGTAGPVQRVARRPRTRRGGAGHQDGPGVRARSRHRPALPAGGRPPGAAGRPARRDAVANAAHAGGHAPAGAHHGAPGGGLGVTLWDRLACARKIASLRGEGLYTPPTESGTLVYPFIGGGANWGSAAFDPRRNLLVVNMSNLGSELRLLRKTGSEKKVNEVVDGMREAPMDDTPYSLQFEALMSPLGLPCTPPPWGVLMGVDLATGQVVWRRVHGTTEDLAPGGLALPLGTPTIGGPIVTAGGLVFIAAAMDDYLRAYDTETGRELWKGRLPAGGQATPMTYRYQGRQYVVVAAGGHSFSGTRLGESLVAYALPRR